MHCRCRSAFILFAAFATLLLPVLSLADILTFEGKVIDVADGDTVTILDSVNEQQRVRIAGIDAPEKGQPSGNASRKRFGEYGAGKEVRIEFEKDDRPHIRDG